MIGRFARWYRGAAFVAPEPALSDPAQLGEQAKRLLADPVLALALDRIGNKIAATWRNTPIGASAEREAAYRLHWAVEQLKGELTVMLANGKKIEAERKRAG